MKSVVVFCGSSNGAEEAYGRQGYLLGKEIALQSKSLIYGGAKIGIMGQVAQGALDHDGKVIGVIPNFLKEREVYHMGVTELIITKDMHERKLKMYELSEGIIMLPGGYGTLEEFFEMLTWAQLGLHTYPIGILNTDGFYDELLLMLQKMINKGFVKKENFDRIIVRNSCTELLATMESYKAIAVPKLIHKKQL